MVCKVSPIVWSPRGPVPFAENIGETGETRQYTDGHVGSASSLFFLYLDLRQEA